MTEKLQDYITKEIKQNIDEHGIHNLLIVAGATPEGIGCVYDIAKRGKHFWHCFTTSFNE
ncbi:hypothetical protein [Arsenophonus sp. PmNCSU2021_1]|uniref:hypothetical protein n=1 Tax=Arsenophonus sp. PmNCSU2021_1 TaxID=3118989 RepID=UPI002FEF8CFE